MATTRKRLYLSPGRKRYVTVDVPETHEPSGRKVYPAIHKVRGGVAHVNFYIPWDGEKYGEVVRKEAIPVTTRNSKKSIKF